MKSLFLGDLSYTKKWKYGTEYFVIGVRDSSWASLESVQAAYPNATIERLPEVLNPRYMHQEDRATHTLQPAFITFLPETESKGTK